MYILQRIGTEEFLDENDDYTPDIDDARYFEDYDDALAYKNDEEIIMRYNEGVVEPIS